MKPEEIAKRNVSIGIPGFIWSDSGDNKVCSFCSERDGKYFSYSNKNVILPSQKQGCRCVAEPLFEDELEDILADPQYKFEGDV